MVQAVSAILLLRQRLYLRQGRPVVRAPRDVPPLVRSPRGVRGGLQAPPSWQELAWLWGLGCSRGDLKCSEVDERKESSVGVDRLTSSQQKGPATLALREKSHPKATHGLPHLVSSWTCFVYVRAAMVLTGVSVARAVHRHPHLRLGKALEELHHGSVSQDTLPSPFPIASLPKH